MTPSHQPARRGGGSSICMELNPGKSLNVFEMDSLLQTPERRVALQALRFWSCERGKEASHAHQTSDLQNCETMNLLF